MTSSKTPSCTKNSYDEDYFERGIETGKSCYSNFRWIPELTIPLCARLIEVLDIKDDQTVLDFGCAKGYVVKAFRLLHRESYGVDVSEYAIKSAPDDTKQYIRKVHTTDKIPLITGRKYSWIIAKDVLEHIPYEHLAGTLQKLREAGNGLFCVVPLGDGEKYIVPAYELDGTHIIRQPLDWWRKEFEKAGFEVKSADHKIKHIKQNWEKWERGNGFFILK